MEQSFEESLDRLEGIIRELDSDGVGLEESLANYEEAVNILKFCYGCLKNAERKIEILRISENENENKIESVDEDSFQSE
ncbi:MAG: exodeoxyribonuclease VII small subunit [Planctomycetaceae bacterium]|jgi:exodeoxyribonuclease VII small subunit|nr:exodeoxyribonuclease VII small subunit [Planctomycetaceae bacterium]